MKIMYLSGLVLSVLSLSACATSIESTYVLGANPNYFADLLPPNQGIRIVSSEEYYKILPSDMKEKEEREFKELKKKGYIEEITSYPGELLNMKTYKTKFSGDVPKNEDLYKNLSDIPLSFLNYSGIPFLSKDKVIGFAPLQTQTDSGWTGVSEFFLNDFGGVCSFDVLDVGNNGGSALYNIDRISYEVNKKPGIITVRGNKSDKFIYSVSWSYKDMDYNLTCANRYYSTSYTKKTVNLAIKIDSSLKLTG